MPIRERVAVLMTAGGQLIRDGKILRSPERGSRDASHADSAAVIFCA